VLVVRVVGVVAEVVRAVVEPEANVILLCYIKYTE
jgi:hypothetical protein